MNKLPLTTDGHTKAWFTQGRLDISMRRSCRVVYQSLEAWLELNHRRQLRRVRMWDPQQSANSPRD